MKKVTVTISGVGVRSAAGLGLLKYLEENNVEVVGLSGTSGGAILSLLYSHGLSIKEINNFTKEIDKFKLFRPSFSTLFSLIGIENQIINLIKNKDRKIPLTVVTTDIIKMEAIYHNEGDLIQETIASCSVNGLFPAKILKNGEKHVDGMYVDNLPNIHLVNKKIKNISINVNNPSINQDIQKRLHKIKEKSLIKYNSSQADIFLDVFSVADVKLLDLSKFEFCIEEGYKIAKDEVDLSNL